MQEDELLSKADNCETILKVNPYSNFTSYLVCLIWFYPWTSN